ITHERVRRQGRVSDRWRFGNRPRYGARVCSRWCAGGDRQSQRSAQGIRINAVNPAVIDTDMVDRIAARLSMEKNDLSTLHPIGRLGRVDEVAEAVLWLCSDRASFVMGHSLLVDGGFTARGGPFKKQLVGCNTFLD